MIGAGSLQRASWQHPEAVAAGIALVAWVVLLVPVAGGDLADAVHAYVHDATPLAAGAAGWIVMATAMMVPATLPVARDLALGALWSRRQRSVVIFLAAYLGVWVAFGAGAYGLNEAGQATLGLSAVSLLPSVLVVAALWELTRCKWRAVRACHLIAPLPPRGAKADVACAMTGLRYGRRCVLACWPLMLAMAVAGHTSLGLMALLTTVVAVEKLAARPARLAVPLAAVLGSAALTSLAA